MPLILAALVYGVMLIWHLGANAVSARAALVEADIGRWKRVIGNALRSQTDERQAAEVAIAVDVLNRMLELGRPSYVRIA